MTVHEAVLDRVARDYEKATHKARELEYKLETVRAQRDGLRKLAEEMSAYHYTGSHWADRFIAITQEIDKEKHEQSS